MKNTWITFKTAAFRTTDQDDSLYMPRGFSSPSLQSIVRGKTSAANWPKDRHRVEAGSYIDVLRVKTGVDFDLPTEAQWEFACRAGSSAAVNGQNPNAQAKYNNALKYFAWFKDNCRTASGNIKSADNVVNYSAVHRVGSLPLANEWGFCDMIGNCWEQCLDYYAEYPTDTVSYEPEGGRDDAATDRADLIRVYRGGSYLSAYTVMRNARRQKGCTTDGAIRLMCPVTLQFPASEK